MLRALSCMVIVQSLPLFAQAAILNVDTVLGADHPYSGETIVVVDGVSPPTNVTVIDGAVIGSLPDGGAVPVGMDVFGASQIKMLGGRIRASQRSVLLHDQSLFTIFAGRAGLIESRDSSRVVLHDGEWGRVNAYDSSRVRVNGGDDSSTFEVETFGQSHAMLNSESFNFAANESSTAVLNSGNFESAVARGNSEILINGGFYHTGVFAFDNAVVRFRDIGSMSEEFLDLSDTATAHFYGTGLRFGILDVDDNLIPAVLGNWANGDRFGILYHLEDQGQIILHEVPEPGSLALLTVGAAGLLVLRRAHFVSPRR